MVQNSIYVLKNLHYDTSFSVTTRKKVSPAACWERLYGSSLGSFQEAVDDLLLCFLLGEAEGHELDKLLAGDLADGGFVDEAGVDAVGGELRRGDDVGVVHDDGVAFGVAVAGGVAVDAADKILHGAILGNAAADDVGAAILAVEVHFKIGLGDLVAGGEDFFVDDEGGAVGEITGGFANGVVDAFDLGGFHLKLGAFGEVEDGGWVHDLLAAAVAFAEMLFDVFDLGIFADVEGVDAVVLAVAATAAVVDAAAGDDGDVAVFADVEIVVDEILEAALLHDDWDVHGFVDGAILNVDLDALAFLLGNDLDIGGGAAAGCLAVGADVVGADGEGVEVGDFL